ALGRVLAEDLCAPIDVPPTDNSAVDGYAVAHAPIPSGERRELTVVGELAAGGVFEGVVGPGQALRIMTGAPMPAGGDTVYPQGGVGRAGGVFGAVVGPGQALRIMTGAPMPAGADTVYPQEVVERAGVRITVGPIERGVNTRSRGEDVRA